MEPKLGTRKGAYFQKVPDCYSRQDSLGFVGDWKTNRNVPQNVVKDLQLKTYCWV